jgi:hypothetical protein
MFSCVLVEITREEEQWKIYFCLFYCLGSENIYFCFLDEVDITNWEERWGIVLLLCFLFFLVVNLGVY